MSLTFPLALADFADVIGIQTVKWQLNDNRELSGMGTGQILQADLAPGLWSAEVTLRPWLTNDAREIEAKINAVVRSMGSFYLYDPRKAVPKSGASALVGYTVKVRAVADGKSLSLQGLPAAYTLSPGDYLSFDYAGSTRRWFGEVAESVTSDSSGNTEAFEVSPMLPAGLDAGTPVTLVKAAMKAIITPGSLDVSYASGFTTIGFSVTQTRSAGRPTDLPIDALVYVNYMTSTPTVSGATRAFERASTGTYLDRNGILQTAAIDALRINYDGAGDRLGALLEGSAANLNPRSGDFSNWVVTNSTIISSSADSPFGAGTATKFVPNTVNGGHVVKIGLGGSRATSGDPIYYATLSKAAGYNYVRLSLEGTSVTTNYQYFDLASGTVGATHNSNISDAGVIDFGDGWYLCWIIVIATATGSITQTAYFANADSLTAFAGDGSSGIAICYAQTDTPASAPSSLIMTASAAATRAADVETIRPTDQTSSFDWYAKYDDDSTGKIASAVTGDFEVDPASLNRPNVKLIWAEAAA